MNPSQSSHQFAEAKVSQIRGLAGVHCELVVRQQPQNARIAVGKEKDRKPIDPPPIVQLRVSRYADASQSFLQSPYVFMTCSLVGQSDHDTPSGSLGTSLAGTLVSSLHRLKDTDNTDGAFFVFADVSVKIEGLYRLKFTLYEMRDNCVETIKETVSNPFPVHSTKNFPGMSESTFLTRSFSDQGVRLRLRKEPRALLRKRGPAHDDYEPRHYNRLAHSNRFAGQDTDRQSERSPDAQDNLRPRGQDDALELQQSQSHPGYEQRPYDQRPQAQRHYSMPSATPYPASLPYSDPSKRPRTGSEQNQISPYTQSTPVFENIQYEARQTVAFYPGYLPFEDPTKRPRTDSEQSLLSPFSQATPSQSIDNIQYAPRVYPESQQGFIGYSNPPSQNGMYGFTYFQ